MPIRRVSAWSLRSRSKSPSLLRRRVDVDFSQRYVEIYVYDTFATMIVAASNFGISKPERLLDNSD